MANQQKKSAAKPKERPKKKAAAKKDADSQQADALALLPGLDATVASYLLPRTAWAGVVPTEPAQALRASFAVPAAASVSRLTPPLQSATVDRSVPNPVFSRDVPIKNRDGEVVQILRRPFNYPSGGWPADPAQFAPGVDPRTAMCHVLSRGGAARCSQGRGYF